MAALQSQSNMRRELLWVLSGGEVSVVDWASKSRLRWMLSATLRTKLLCSGKRHLLVITDSWTRRDDRVGASDSCRDQSVSLLNKDSISVLKET